MGYKGTGFFPLWDITEEFFSAVGYNGEGFPPLWDTTKEGFFHCGIQRKTVSRWQTNFSLLYPTMQEIFLPLYPSPQQNLMQCTVSQKNFPHCIPQRRRFYSVVSHNRRYFPPLWDTTEKVFLSCGIQRKKLSTIVGSSVQRKGFFSILGYNGRVFFPCGIQWKKIIQHRMVFLNFKCLSLPSNKNLGKICYLNS